MFYLKNKNYASELKYTKIRVFAFKQANTHTKCREADWDFFFTMMTNLCKALFYDVFT